jgi:hypothetical protein
MERFSGTGLNAIKLRRHGLDAGKPHTILDRLPHRAETVVLEGKSYCVKDRLGDDLTA